jgi:hypothetical protein
MSQDKFLVCVSNLDDRFVALALMVVACVLADGFRPYVLLSAAVALACWVLVDLSRARVIARDNRELRRRNRELAEANQALAHNNLQLTSYVCRNITDMVKWTYENDQLKARHNKLLDMLHEFRFRIHASAADLQDCRAAWAHIMESYQKFLVYLHHEPIKVPGVVSVTEDAPAMLRELLKLQSRRDHTGKERFYLPHNEVEFVFCKHLTWVQK